MRVRKSKEFHTTDEFLQQIYYNYHGYNYSYVSTLDSLQAETDTCLVSGIEAVASIHLHPIALLLEIEVRVT